VTGPTQGTSAAEPPAESSEARDGGSGAHVEYAEVGQRVIGILEAAEAAAEEIRAEAAAAAEEIRKAAEAEAEASRQKAGEEAAALREQAETAAEEIRSSAEGVVETRRQEAEEVAQGILGDAEEQAGATRQAAEEAAKRIEAEALEREELILEQVQPLEENLRRALEAFRGISGQLEELLADLPGSRKGSLVEDLAQSVRQADAS
jgi:hypothetical protein